MIKAIAHIIGVVALSLVATSATAQDLIARQSPVDRRMNMINAVKFGKATTKSTADLSNPAAHIYTNWTESFRNATGFLAAGSRIDLRGFVMPTDSRKVTSNYGSRWHRQHEGMDIKVYVGDTIRAAFDGKVRIRDYNGGGYGYYLVLRHPNGLETLYGHLSKQLVEEGQIVRAGEPIGLGGNTGRSTGSHLHFETRICGTPINPAEIFDFEHQDVTGNFYTTRRNYGKESQRPFMETLAAHTSNAEASFVEVAAVQSEQASAEPQEAEESAPATTKKAAPQRRASAARTHKVRKGDSLYSIARENGTTVEKLLRANGLKSNAVLRPGQRIKINEL